MTQITVLNFEENYPIIKKQIYDCTFISFDCEFTGLSETIKESLFDTSSERFKKIKENISDFLIIQFGLGIFKYDRDNNKFQTNHYSFYLLPHLTPASKNIFRVDSSAFRFLSKTNFDWNKLFKEGLGYLRYNETEALKRMIEDNTLCSSLCKQFWFEEISIIELMLSKVQNWLAKEKDKPNELVLDCLTTDPCLLYYITQEIRKEYPTLWASFSSPSSITVSPITESEKEKQLIESKKILDEYFSGFSKVLADLISAKRPMVGHNCFKDLAMIYQQFFWGLPNQYDEFKSKVHNLFPCIYDTKHLCYALRPMMPRDAKFEPNSLEELYRYLRDGKGSSLVLFGPVVESNKDGIFHDAGFDAFCTGYCFIKLCYFFSVCDKERRKIEVKGPQTWAKMMNAVLPCKNKINMIRGRTDYMKMDGPDPPSTCPQVLLIRSIDKLDPVKVRALIHCHSDCDVQSLSRNAVLLAVKSQRAIEDIRAILLAYGFQVDRYFPLSERLRSLKVQLVGTCLLAAFTIFLYLKK